MNKYVVTYNLIEGYHKYPEAPEFCDYLSHKHRHLFEIRCWIRVSHNEREIEINKMQEAINNYLHKRFGTPCQFGDMSCESICDAILEMNAGTMAKIQVLEDGFGGAYYDYS